MDTKWIVYHVYLSPLNNDIAADVVGVFDDYITALHHKDCLRTTEAPTSSDNKRIFIHPSKPGYKRTFTFIEKAIYKPTPKYTWVVYRFCYLEGRENSKVLKIYNTLEEAEEYVKTMRTAFKYEKQPEENKIIYGTKMKNNDIIIERVLNES